MAAKKSSVAFNTLERENLFRNPPKDKSAYPALLAAVQPHIDSFNAITVDGGLLDLAREDIGIKSVFDGTNEKGSLGNKLSCMDFLLYLIFFSIAEELREKEKAKGNKTSLHFKLILSLFFDRNDSAC